MRGKLAPPPTPANLCGVWQREGPSAPPEGRDRQRTRGAPGSAGDPERGSPLPLRPRVSRPSPCLRRSDKGSEQTGSRWGSRPTPAHPSRSRCLEVKLSAANTPVCAHRGQYLDARAPPLARGPAQARTARGGTLLSRRARPGLAPSRRRPRPAAPALTGRGSSRRPAAGAEGSRRLQAPSPRAGSPGSRCAARLPRLPAEESRPCGARTPGSGSWRERPAGRGPALRQGTSASGCAETRRAGARDPRPTGRRRTRALGTKLRRGFWTSVVPSSASGSQAGRGRSRHSGVTRGPGPSASGEGTPRGGGRGSGAERARAGRRAQRRGRARSGERAPGGGITASAEARPRSRRPPPRPPGVPTFRGIWTGLRSQPVWPPPLSGPGEPWTRRSHTRALLPSLLFPFPFSFFSPPFSFSFLFSFRLFFLPFSLRLSFFDSLVLPSLPSFFFLPLSLLIWKWYKLRAF